MAPSDHDLKAQLSDIQKRLSEATFSSPKRAAHMRKDESSPTSSVDQAGNQRPSHPLSQSTAASNMISTEGDANKKRLSNFLTKREKRVSLPVLDTAKSPSIKSSGKDMDFVVGLSENLLVECRRLQAENQQKSTQLKCLEEEFNRLKLNNSSLMNRLNETVQNEEKHKDMNWELELKFQQMSQEFKAINENYNKSQKELEKQISYTNQMRAELEEVNLNKHSLEKEFSTNKVSVTQEIHSLKEHVDELNDVNSRLNDEIDELRQSLEEANKKPKMASISDIPMLQPQPESDSEDEFNEPSTSPVKVIPANNKALETEQLQTSLSSAHQTIAKLRQQILKLRSNELKNRHPEPKGPSLPPLSLKKSSKNLVDSPRVFKMMGDSNRSSTYVVEDQNLEDDDWENSEGENTVSNSEYAITPSKKPTAQRPLSTASITSNELIDDSSDSESEMNTNFVVAPLSSELPVITADDVERYAQDHGLILLPADEYESLNAKSPIVKDSPFKNFKEADIVSKAKERGFNIFSQSEWATQKQELDEKTKEIKSLGDRLTLISETEMKYAKEAAEYRTRLTQAAEEIKASNLKVEELESKLNNPSPDFITEKATGLGLNILQADDHSALLSEIESLRLSKAALSKSLESEVKTREDLKNMVDNPSVEFIKEKASAQGLRALDIAVHEKELSELKDSIAALEHDLEATKVESAKKDKETAVFIAALKKDLDEPSLEYIQDKAQAQGFKAVKVTDYESELEQLHTTIKALEQELDLSKTEHSKKEESSSKSMELLKSEISATVGELDALKEKLEDITTERDELQSSVASHKEELDSATRNIAILKRELDHPSHDYLTEKSTAQGFTIIPKLEYSSLSEKSSRTIHDLAKEGDYAVLKQAEFAELQQKAIEPSIDHLVRHAETHKHKVIPEVEFTQLADKANRSIDDHAFDEGAVVLKQDDYNELKRKADAPTVQELSELAEAQNFSVISAAELSDLQDKSSRTAEDLAKENNSIVIPADSYKELVRKSEEPQIDEITSFAAKHNYDVIPKADHEQLKQAASKTIEDHAKEQNIVLLSDNEHRELTRKASKPSVQEISALAAGAGLVALATTAHSTLVAKSTRSISELAKESGSVVVPQAKYQELLDKVESPSIGHLGEKAQSLGYSLLPITELSQLTKKSQRSVEDLAAEKDLVLMTKAEQDKLNNPPREALIEKVEKLGLVAVPFEEHQSLLEVSKAPKLDHLIEKAKILGYSVVSNIEFSELQKSVSSPTKEFILTNAARHGLVAVPQTEYDQNKQELSTLKKVMVNHDLLAEKISSEGNVVLKQENYDELFDKANTSIEDLAKSQGKVLLEKDTYDSLLNPSMDSITAVATKHNFVVVPQEDYHNLVRENELPSIEYLRSKADFQGHAVVSKSHYDMLENTANKPSVDFLKEKSAVFGFALVEQNEIDELRRKVSVPLEDLAKEKDKILLSQQEFESFKHPDHESITKAASALGLIALDKEEYNSLKKSVETPDMKFIEEKAKIYSHVIIPQEEFDELNSVKESPSADFLSEKSKNHNLTLIPVGDYDQLKSRSIMPIEDIAAERNMVVLPQDEYKSLKEPSKESLLAKIGVLGFVGLAASEHAKLLKPSVKDLEKYAASNNMVVVPKETFGDLTQKSSRSIHDLAGESNLKVLSVDEFEKLKSPSTDTLIKLASAAGLVAITGEKYKELSNPPLESLVSNVEQSGYSVLPKDQLTELQFKSTRTIDDLAKETDSVVLSKDEHKLLLEPSRDTVISHAANIGLVTLSQDEFKDLKNPSKQELVVLAEREGLKTLETSAYQELLTPTRQATEKHAANIGAVVLDEEEYHSLLKPSEEEIKNQAEKNGLVVLPKDDYNLLQNPSKESVQELAKLNGLIAVEASEYHKLEATGHNPTKEFLTEKADTLGFVVSSKDEFAAISERASKSIQDLAAENKSLVVSHEEYHSLNNPSLEKLTSKAKDHEHVVVPSEKLNFFENPSVEHLSEKAKTLGFALVPNEELEDMISTTKTPSESFIQERAAGLGLITVDSKKQEQFVQDYLVSQELQSVPNTEIEALRSGETLELPVIQKRLSALGHVAVDSETYEKLTSELSRDEILKLCEKKKLKAVDVEEYEKLMSQPTEKEIIELVGASGLVGVHGADYTTLKTKAENPDKDLIKKQGYVLKDELSYEDVEELANRFQSKLVAVGDEPADGSFSNLPNPSVSTFASTINESEFTDALSHVQSQASTLEEVQLQDTNEVGVDELRTAALRLGFNLVPVGDSTDREVTASAVPELTRDGEDADEDSDQYDTVVDEREEILKRADNLGLVVLEKDAYQSLTHQVPTEDDLKSEAEKLGLVVLSAFELDSVAKTAVENVKPEALINQDNIRSFGEQNNLKVLTNDEYEDLKKSAEAESNWTPEKVSLGASLLGMTVLSQQQARQISPSLSNEKGNSRASEPDSVVADHVEHRALTTDAAGSEKYVGDNLVGLPALSTSEVIKQAENSGQIASRKEEPNNSKENAPTIESDTEPGEEGKQIPLSREELSENAAKLGLLTIPENAFIATNISRVPDVNNVVVLPVTYYNKLTKSEVLNLDKITNEELQEQAAKRGFHLSSADSEIKDTVSISTKPTVTSLSTVNSRRAFADHSEQAALYEYENPTLGSGFSRSSSRNPSIRVARGGNDKTISRDASVNGGLSLMTNASLTESRMIPALTQTIIGEYLHKYYRRLGPLSSVSETRHERYFWIHPYTLTLYWSTTSPVLGNPASQKTRAAAIIGVESVDDNTPLPAGLHHKSIIVHSQTRSIKFTCPTRQRHNIWYNSLRYLIQRSMDGIELEDEFDHLLEGRKL